MMNELKLSALYICIILGVAIYGCSTNKLKDEPSSIGSSDKVTSPTPPPTVGGVTFIPDSKNKEEIMLVTVASDKVNETIQGDCFKKFMLERNLIQTKGQSNEQVVQTLRSAKGTIKVKFYKKWMSSEIAVRYPPSSDINFNRNFWTGITNVCKWASTLAHEGLGHVLGDYDHDFRYSKSRDFSVPYSINFAFDACCR